MRKMMSVALLSLMLGTMVITQVAASDLEQGKPERVPVE